MNIGYKPSQGSALKFVVSILVCVLLSILCEPTARAQITGTTDATQTPVAGAGHDYVHMLNETVNPESGSVSINIKVPVPPGRKLNLPFSFQYNSGGALFVAADWELGWGATWTSSTAPLTAGGWSYFLPSASRVWKTYTIPPQPPSPDGSTTCSATLGYIFTDANGTQHDLFMSHVYNNYPTTYNGNNYPVNYACQQSGFLSSETDAGGDGIVLSKLASPTSGQLNTAPSDGGILVADPDGTVYSFLSGPLTPQASDNALTVPIDGMGDRNGNGLGVQYTLYPNGNPQANEVSGFTMKDTLGRTAVLASNFGQGASVVTVSGISQPYTANWENWNYSGYTVNTQNETTGGDCAGSGGTFPGEAGTESVIQSLTLPNGQSYQFLYDSTYGTLKEVDYPTGGKVQYTWGPDSLSTLLETTDRNLYNACYMYLDTAAVQTRTVYDGSQQTLQQSFSYQTQRGTNGWSSKTTTVTTQDFIQDTTFQTIYTYSPVEVWCGPNGGAGNCSQVGVESSIAYYDINTNGGGLIKTVYKGWYDQNRLACEMVAYPNGLVSGTFYAYGPGGQITDKKEYDFGIINSSEILNVCPQVGTPNPPANPTRETVTTYQSFAATSMPTPSILDRPSSVIVCNGACPAGKVAETDYSYDQYGVASASTPMGTHNETYYSSGSTVPRGNLTTMTKQCLTSCANATTTYSYDETGQIVSMTDPCGNASCSDMPNSANHTTHFSYNDSYTSCNGNPPPAGNTNAYVTQIIYPSTSGTSHSVQLCYGYDDGQLRGSTNENGQTTAYKYSDPLGRLTESDYPDGGKTSIAYNDTKPSPTVTTTKEMNSSQSVVTVDVMNGLGVETNQELTDPQGTDSLSYKVLDGFGRPHHLYNPYRSTSDPTYGDITYVYDALGRTLSVTKQDNSIVSTSYSNNCTTVKDEAGKTRESCTDGLGRLKQVFEDPTGNNWETDYTYDALNDLISVVQGGSRSRNFQYDSLGRMTQSNNPESGIISYTYDANGNVETKHDARNITSTYSYDVLNRVTGFTYSNSDPSVSYAYDQSSCLGQPTCFNIGHRTTMADAGGAEYYAYDKVGRLISQKRTTCPSACINENTTYGYDLAGDLTTVVYPSGRIVNYVYDSAGRVSTAQDAKSGSYYAYGACANGLSSNGVCYAPQGSIAQMQTGSNVVTTTIFNVRLQPCWIYATTGTALAMNTSCTSTDPSPGNILDLQYCYYTRADGACQQSTTNNGDVMGIVNNRDSNRSQSFTYDPVNRIVTAQSEATYSASPNTCWGESYSYDQWANLYANSEVSSAYGGCVQDAPFSLSPTANNQFSGYSYDASGNILNDANSYSWNAESEITSAAGVTYTYDGDGNRVAKSNGKLYWYGLGGEILDESDGNGNVTDEYIFFGGKRIAHITY